MYIKACVKYLELEKETWILMGSQSQRVNFPNREYFPYDVHNQM
jgi:hypothetical protein